MTKGEKDVENVKDGMNNGESDENEKTDTLKDPVGKVPSDNIIVHEDGTVEYKVPYYLENFLLVINSVVKDDFFGYLFDEDDQRAIETFLSLPGKKT